MASLVKQLIEAGIHFGNRTSGWNPKMGPYIYTKKNGIHVIDVRHTVKGLLLGKKYITRTVADGKDVLFVGTKRQARPAIQKVCDEVGMPYVIERWLGGTLTNFATIRSRLKRLDQLEALMNSEEWENYSKKMAAQLSREREKIERNLGGIRNLNKLPGAMVVIDVRREHNAVKEARKLGIPTICLLDTDADPDFADIPIPGNDDAMRAIELIVTELAEAAKEGKSARAAKAREQERAQGGSGEGQEQGGSEQKGSRRSNRSQYRAEGATGASAAADGAGDATSAGTPAASDASSPEQSTGGEGSAEDDAEAARRTAEQAEASR